MEPPSFSQENQLGTPSQLDQAAFEVPFTSTPGRIR
jgi:hypothetical protein